MLYAEVAIPKALPKPLSYAVPKTLEGALLPGHRVAVPLSSRQSVGFVMKIKAGDEVKVEIPGIKEIIGILDAEPVFSGPMLELLAWMSNYYMTPMGQVCRAALPPRMCELSAPKLTRPTSPPETWTGSSGAPNFELNVGQRKALRAILENLNSPSTPSDSPLQRGRSHFYPPGGKPVLLHGITGSGKTEIYLRTFEEIKKMGGCGLLLTPEISLTPQLVERFRDRFGDEVAVYHSGLTDAQRQDQWERMKKGRVFAAVGTRSALFAPFEKLSLIVVDEEHDGSYKQDEGFLYNARDSAVMRAKLEKATAVLGSATPSVESFTNARSGKYILCDLPERAAGAVLPDIEIIDMRTHSGGSFAGGTVGAIKEALEKKEQVLLFLNRRGFANFLLCGSCGAAIECPNCDITLTHHASPPRMLCHYCDYQIPAPDTCPGCSSINLIPMGKGTQRLEEELSKLFPKANIARLDRDTTAKAASRRTFLSKMQKGEIDILVGTQLIAKGHDFPNVTLVCVVDADVALHLPDFRSFERTFQILTQVAGRAGRAEKKGRVIIQTYQPDHPALVHARDHDYLSFFEMEHEHRKVLKYPPFARAANIRFSGNSEKTTEAAADAALKIIKEKRRALKLENEVLLLGPAPAPLKKVRGRFRYQLLVKAPGAGELALLLNAAVPAVNAAIPKSCRIVVDVDPINML